MLVEIRSTRGARLANNSRADVESTPKTMMPTTNLALLPSKTPRDRLSELFSENVTAKLIRTATQKLVDNACLGTSTRTDDFRRSRTDSYQDPPKKFPETVPQIGPNYGQYQSKNIDFWTCGFFAGSLYSLLERAIKYPHTIQSDNPDFDLPKLRRRLQVLAQAWSDPIHGESRLTNTHDLGFIQMPHMRPRWELFHDEKALNTILKAAKSLHTRFSPAVGAIRSWDQLTWLKIPPIVGMDDNFIVIIDSMCNLDLLFYAAAHSGDKQLADAAITHARTLLKSHLRLEPSEPEQRFPGSLYSTCHVVNFSPITGEVKGRCTAQGYSKSSTWSRGQAWAILGYAQTYVWTGEREFLETACGLAEYFLLRLEKAPAAVEVPAPDGSGRRIGKYVPVWDFDAPIEDGEPPLRDTSAGTAAANGLLILAQSLAGQGLHDLSDRFLQGGLKIVEETLEFSLADEKARLDIGTNGEMTGIDVVQGECFESILKNATVCNNPMSNHRTKDHGLVYADYYLVEFGTRLLRLRLA